MKNIDLEDTYTIDLYKEETPVCKLTYNFKLSSSANILDRDFTAAATEEDRQLINDIVDGVVIFTYGGKGRIESIKMRTYKPGTVSHFVSLTNKFATHGYRVECSKTTERLYQEILNELY